jgi:glutathione peroxidase
MDFVVLGFPCNQFLNQEPGNEKEIQTFCTENYNVTFPMFKKIKVNGPDTHPLYHFLKRQAPGFLGRKRIPWNFTKFLVNKDGMKIKRFPPSKKPHELQKEIELFIKNE